MLRTTVTRESDEERFETIQATRTADPSLGGVPAHGGNEPPLPQGTLLHDLTRYEFRGEHGRGGLGRVSRAYDKNLGRDIAIKESLSPTRTSEARFLREALITARLEHPGIVPIYEAGRWPDGTPFYAMKLVAGRSLRELLAERKTIDARFSLLHHVIAVADAIAFAHERGVIHRDLKPANVIIGDFGETIVIDWGLAKVLGQSDEPADATSLASPGEPELTADGAVLGTPSYMAPEQERGERVDRRADVFTIGAMLWEVCALEKVPPADSQLRDRRLRRAGISADLIAIIGKALHPVPLQRYADAGQLATDLKAFKSGSRISARRYSAAGLIAHWGRRHRAAAVATLAVAILSVIGTTLYIRGLSVERDRAEQSQRATSAANNTLILEHGQMLLQTDPTAAAATLAEYRDAPSLRLRMLQAEAVGRGISTLVGDPHTDAIWFMTTDDTGAVISLGKDGKICASNDGQSQVLASDASTDVRYSFSPQTRELAYATPKGINVLDLRTREVRPFVEASVIYLLYSPDGSRLAAISDRDELIVWDVRHPQSPRLRAPVRGIQGIRMLDADTVVVRGDRVVSIVDVNGAVPERRVKLARAISSIDAMSEAIVVGFEDGSIMLLSRDLAPLAQLVVCHGEVGTARFAKNTNRLVYSCLATGAGIVVYDLNKRELTRLAQFQTQGRAQALPSLDGRYVTIIDDSKVARVQSIETGVTARFHGMAGKPTAMLSPTGEIHRVIIGDSNGVVRQFDAPVESTIAMRAPFDIIDIRLAADGSSVIAHGTDLAIWESPLIGPPSRLYVGHAAAAIQALISPDGKFIVSSSYDGMVRTWSRIDGRLLRVFREHKGFIGEILFIEDGKRIVSIAEDGKMFAWSPDGSDTELLFFNKSALNSVEYLRERHVLVVCDSSNRVWVVRMDHRASQVNLATTPHTRLVRSSIDGTQLAITGGDGEVIILDTNSWGILRRLVIEGNAKQLRFDPRNRDLIVASESSRTRSARVRRIPLGSAGETGWSDVELSASEIAYSSAGEMTAFASQDGVWLYHAENASWRYLPGSDGPTVAVAFSEDGQLLVSAERSGEIIVRRISDVLETQPKNEGVK